MNTMILNCESYLPEDVRKREIMLKAYRSDARTLGSMVESIIAEEFGMTVVGDNGPFDLIDDQGVKYEVRARRSDAAYDFESASNCGKSRAGQNPQDTVAKQEIVDQWIFCDVGTFPMMKIDIISREEVKKLMAANSGRKDAKVAAKKVEVILTSL